MSLTEDEKRQLREKLDKCDASLVDKPTLTNIYNSEWRAEFGSRILSVDSLSDVAYPNSYASPIFEEIGLFPPAYQYRIEEGARILLPKLNLTERNHLSERMRGGGCLSAEEELLLARGFVNEFGNDAIAGPTSIISEQRPEFMVSINGITIDIEAKGLLDSCRIRQLNEAAGFVGQNYWISSDPRIDDIRRVRSALAGKLLNVTPDRPRIVVLTQYSAWPVITESIDLSREISLDPGSINIETRKHPISIALVSQRYIQGVWFSTQTRSRYHIDTSMQERLRRALRNSFYPRQDELFFDETMDDEAHRSLLQHIHDLN